jgi:sortase A
MTWLTDLNLSDVGKAVVIALSLSGIVCLSEAAWIHVKASLAQVMIGAAWRRERTGSRDTQPWPWADTRPLAVLRFGEGPHAPTLMVLEGSSGRNLAFGPAHDPASVLPGDTGNSVIEGHRDTHFALLRNLKVGDRLQVDTLSHGLVSFRVAHIAVVDSRRARIALQADTARLTLVTCYPFDAVAPGGPLRWVVTADRIGP